MKPVKSLILPTLFLIVLCFVNFYAKAQQIVVEKPVLPVVTFDEKQIPLSEIHIPVEIDLLPLYAMAEKNVDTLFTSPNYPNDWVQAGCDTRYKYSFRRGPLSIKASGTAMEVRFMGYYRIIGSTRACIGGVAASPWTSPCRCGFDEPERRVQVGFKASFTVMNDYSVKLNVTALEPAPLDKCEVCFWGQDITPQVIDGIKTALEESRKELIKTYASINLKEYIEPLWKELSTPQSMMEMGWLSIQPEKMHMNNLYAKDNKLYAFLGLSARPVLTFNRPETKPKKLPVMSALSRLPGFNIYADASLNYDSLSQLVNKYVVGESFTFKKGIVNKKFVFKNCRLYGADNDQLVVQVDFEGTDKGTIYLTGTPYYDEEKKQLQIKDLDFDMRTKDALLKTANWLFNRKIVTQIHKYTQFDLSDYIQQANEVIGEQLNKEWYPGVKGEGKVSDLKIAAIYPKKEALTIRSQCAGTLTVKVGDLKF